LLKLFNKYKVKYCIVGAFAVGFHIMPRYTKDIDILVEPNIENGKKIVKALNDFGFSSLKLTPKDFNRKNAVIQLGYEPVRIDIITSVAGCSFKEVWRNKEKGRYGTEDVFFIGLEELIKTKEAASRKQDKADLELLYRKKKRN
jgi:hypothetical protein